MDNDNDNNNGMKIASSSICSSASRVAQTNDNGMKIASSSICSSASRVAQTNDEDSIGAIVTCSLSCRDGSAIT